MNATASTNIGKLSEHFFSVTWTVDRFKSLGLATDALCIKSKAQRTFADIHPEVLLVIYVILNDLNF